VTDETSEPEEPIPERERLERAKYEAQARVEEAERQLAELGDQVTFALSLVGARDEAKQDLQRAEFGLSQLDNADARGSPPPVQDQQRQAPQQEEKGTVTSTVEPTSFRRRVFGWVRNILAVAGFILILVFFSGPISQVWNDITSRLPAVEVNVEWPDESPDNPAEDALASPSPLPGADVPWVCDNDGYLGKTPDGDPKFQDCTLDP